MVKLVESEPWSMKFESDVKGFHIEVIPRIGMQGLGMDYKVKKGLNYATNSKHEVLNFNSVDSAEGFIKRNKDKIK